MNHHLLHQVRLQTDHLNVLGVDGYLPIFGRWSKISFSVYTRRVAVYGCDDDYATLINFGLRSVSNKTTKVDFQHGFLRITREDEFDGNAMYAVRDGVIGIYVGEGGHRRVIEQEIVIPSLYGNILEFSYLADGGEDAGRTIANGVLRKMESVIETIRQSILSNLSSDFRDQFVANVAKRYNQHTELALNTFVASINWRMLLMQSHCDERCASVMDYTLQHNPITHVGIDEDSSNVTPFSRCGIQYRNVEREHRIYEAELERRREEEQEHNRCCVAKMIEQDKANRVAADMMLEVLGNKFATQFAEEGRITITENGYSFDIRPNRFIHCVDPDGGTAELCIHTVGMSCNPIDEMILAVLNIRHYFAEYMNKAIVHCPQGFHKPNQQKRKSA